MSLSSKKARSEKVCNENEDNHLIDIINDAENCFIDYLGVAKMLDLIIPFSISIYNLKSESVE